MNYKSISFWLLATTLIFGFISLGFLLKIEDLEKPKPNLKPNQTQLENLTKWNIYFRRKSDSLNGIVDSEELFIKNEDMMDSEIVDKLDECTERNLDLYNKYWNLKNKVWYRYELRNETTHDSL